jgi:uncharacterized protein
MMVQEHAIVFDCEDRTLVGVLTLPTPPRAIGLVVVVGGPQYRVGSHRQFVLLARRAATEGFPVLRFDYRGMGDSEGEPRTFDDIDRDIGAAIEALMQAVPATRQVVLYGLCDGASASLMYASHGDRRVTGLCLLNPWVRTVTTLARTRMRSYYIDRLRQVHFWKKLLHGGVGLAAIGELLDTVRRGFAKPGAAVTRSDMYVARMARAWSNFGGRILLVLSGNDYTAREFEQACASDRQWRGALKRRAVDNVPVPDADHTFSDPVARRKMENAFLSWLSALDAEGQARAPNCVGTSTHAHLAE